MAPEIFENKDYTIKADVYSYAVRSFMNQTQWRLDCVVWDNHKRDSVSEYKEPSCNHEICYSWERKTWFIKNSTKLSETSKILKRIFVDFSPSSCWIWWCNVGKKIQIKGHSLVKSWRDWENWKVGNSTKIDFNYIYLLLKFVCNI